MVIAAMDSACTAMGVVVLQCKDGREVITRVGCNESRCIALDMRLNCLLRRRRLASPCQVMELQHVEDVLVNIR
jgi:hypothetical protein